MGESRDVARMSEIVGAQPSFMWSSIDFSALRSPIVYAWLRDGRARYIGMSLRGAQRPLDHGHDHILTDSVRDGDSFCLWSPTSEGAAVEAEERAISELKPLMNRRRIFIPIIREPRPDRRPSRDAWRPLLLAASNVERAAQAVRMSLSIPSLLRFNPRPTELLTELKRHIADLESEMRVNIG